MLTVLERLPGARPACRYPDAAEVARRWPRLTRNKPAPAVTTTTTPPDRKESQR